MILKIPTYLILARIIGLIIFLFFFTAFFKNLSMKKIFRGLLFLFLIAFVLFILVPLLKNPGKFIDQTTGIVTEYKIRKENDRRKKEAEYREIERRRNEAAEAQRQRAESVQTNSETILLTGDDSVAYQAIDIPPPPAKKGPDSILVGTIIVPPHEYRVWNVPEGKFHAWWFGYSVTAMTDDGRTNGTGFKECGRVKSFEFYCTDSVDAVVKIYEIIK